MFDGMTDSLTGGDPILTQSIVTNLSEGTLAAGLAVLQDEFPDINIGSYPYFKKGKLGVNLVSRSTDSDALEKLGMRIKELIISLNGDVINQV